MAAREFHGVVRGMQVASEANTRYSRLTVFYFQVGGVSHAMDGVPIDPNCLIEYDKPFHNGDELYTYGSRRYDGKISVIAAVALNADRVVFVKNPTDPKKGRQFASLLAIPVLVWACFYFFDIATNHQMSSGTRLVAPLAAICAFGSFMCVRISISMREAQKFLENLCRRDSRVRLK